MPKMKTSKSSKQPSRESTLKPAEKPAEKPADKPADKPAETAEQSSEVAFVSSSWSSWVWSDELKLYYRGKLGVDSTSYPHCLLIPKC